MIIVCAKYSLPSLRGGSPVHFSSGPRMANRTPAFRRIRAKAWATFRFRSSNDAAQPTQYRTSVPSAAFASAIVWMPRPSAHRARRSQPVPHSRAGTHRCQRFSRRVRRAIVRATSAFRARVAVEELPPRELFHAVHAERLRLLEVNFLQRAAWREIHEERVDDGEDDEHVFRVGHVREEGEKKDDMRPPEEVPPGRVRGDDQESHQRRRNRLPRGKG